MTTFWIVFIIALLFCSTVVEALALTLVCQDRDKYKEIAESYTMELDPVEIASSYDSIWKRTEEDEEYWKEHWD